MEKIVKIEFEKGESIVDKLTGFEEQVLDITSSSVCITQKKRTEAGINCSQWFDATQRDFKERFYKK